MQITKYVSPDLLKRFEFHDYNHALAIITQEFPGEWAEIEDCLRRLRITTDELRKSGGNETDIPKKFEEVLAPYDWHEIRIAGDLTIQFYPRRGAKRSNFSHTAIHEKVIRGYIDGHNIDFLKGRIALDLE